MGFTFVRIWYLVCDLEVYKGKSNCQSLSPLFIEEAEEMQRDFLDEDIIGIGLEPRKMYFDGATN